MSLSVSPIQAHQSFSRLLSVPSARQKNISNAKLSRIISQNLFDPENHRQKISAIKFLKLRPMKLPNVGIQKRSKTRRRIKTPFTANATISRSIGEIHGHRFKIEIDKVEESKAADDLFDRVQDHSYRRIQVFYYQCVAYFNEQCTITLGKTVHQHGFSSCNDCSAAHSSLLPALQDNLVLALRNTLIREGLTDHLIDKLQSLGVSKIMLVYWKSINEWNADDIIKEIPDMTWQSLLSQNCYLYQVMNSTVEVPALVNIFDTCIEKIMRPTALGILNQVAKGLLDPFAGAKLLEGNLRDFFQKSESETMQKIEIFGKVKELEEQLNTLEKSTKTSKMKPRFDWTFEYLMALRDIRRYKTQFESLKDYSLNFKQDWNEYKPMAVLEAVFTFYVNEKGNVEQLESFDMLNKYVESRQATIQSLISKNEDLKETFAIFQHFTNFYKKKEILLQFLDECNPIDFALSEGSRVKQIFQWLVEAAFTTPVRTPCASQEKIDKLQESLLICRLQEQGSTCPSLDILSGGQSFDVQKLQLWQRSY